MPFGLAGPKVGFTIRFPFHYQTLSLDCLLNSQKPRSDKCGLGFNFAVSTSKTPHVTKLRLLLCLFLLIRVRILFAICCLRYHYYSMGSILKAHNILSHDSYMLLK
jgi:hypothetical protein